MVKAIWFRLLLAVSMFALLWAIFDVVTTNESSGEVPFLVFYIVTGAIIVPVVYGASLGLATFRIPRYVSFPIILFTLQCGLFAFGYLSNEIYEAGGRAIVLDHKFTSAGWSIYSIYAVAAAVVSAIITAVLFAPTRHAVR